MKKLLKKLQLEFNKFVKAISKKIADRKAIRAKLKREKKLAIEKFNYEKGIKDSFEKSFKVKSDEIKTIMYNGFSRSFPEFKQTDPKVLDEKLVEGRIAVNKNINALIRHEKRYPFFYNPEICDIHNENPDREDYISINDLLAEEAENDQRRLNPDKANIRRKANIIWKTRE